MTTDPNRLLGAARTLGRSLLALAVVPLAAIVTSAQPPSPPPRPTPPGESPSTRPSPPSTDDANEGPYATPALLSESAALVPGSVAMLAVHFSIAEGWHTYWNGRNDTGFALKPTWNLPAGYELAGPLEWPAPIRHTAEGEILDHVYENSVAILVPVRVPASAKPGDTATIGAHLTWLTCKSACVFEEADVTITLPIVAIGTLPKASGDVAAFAATRARLAKPLPAADDLRVGVERVGDAAFLAVRSAKAPFVEFYPDGDCVGTPNIFHDGASKDGKLRIELGSETGTDGRARRVAGVLMVAQHDPKSEAKPGNSGSSEATRPQFFRIDLPMPEVKGSGSEPARP